LRYADASGDGGEQFASSVLLDVAGRSANLLADRDWRHRRVDSVVLTENLNARVRTSIDFVIPPQAPSMEGGGYYLPVGVIAKWPPLDSFDLTNERGHSLPLLTTAENREMDIAALCALIPDGMGRASEELKRCAGEVIRSDPADASTAFAAWEAVLGAMVEQAQEQERIVWASVSDWAVALATNSLLWVPVDGEHGDRRIVKFSYEQPLAITPNFLKRVRQSLSWAAVPTSFPIPQISGARSYHMQFEAPRDLQIISASLYLARRSEPVSGPVATPIARQRVPPLPARFRPWFRDLIAEAMVELKAKARHYATVFMEPEGHSSLPPMERQPPPGDVYQRIHNRRAHFYLSEPPLDQSEGGIQLRLRATRRGLITGPLVAAVLIALVMTVYAATATTITSEHLPAAVTVLVLVPGLIGYLAARPDEHPLLRVYVRSVRLLLLLAASVPISAAVMLVAIGDGQWVQGAWIGLATISWLLAGLLALSWLLPPSRGNR